MLLYKARVLLEDGRAADALALLEDPQRRIRDTLAQRAMKVAALQALGRADDALALIR
jgi:hypothetical protein